jgi:hypothetical protein
MQSSIEWLLEKNQPSIRHQTLTTLLDRSINEEEVREAYSQIAKKGWAKEILKEQLPGFRVGNSWQFQGYWHNYSLLNRPKYISTVWKFLVLIDLGLTAKNHQVEKTCSLLSDRYLKRKENYHLCMTANISRALIQAGYDEHNRIRSALDWLVSEQKEDGGWHCFNSSKGTLDCWEPLSAFAALPKSRWNRRIKRSVERGSEFYLERRLYREGTHRYAAWFRFHYPTHYYYDLLVGLDVLSSLGYGKDRRMNFALDLLRKRQREGGRWIMDALHPDISKDLPETSYSSVPPYEPFPAIPFGLEKVGKPSKIITLRALRVLNRVEDS